MRFKFAKKEEKEKISSGPGVYCFKDKKEIFYIGKAKNLKKRVLSHFHHLSPFTKKAEKIGYFETNSEIEAFLLEAELIKRFQPKFNILWRDDKNYFFLGITKEDFPRVFITHQLKEKKEKIEFFGPFIDGKALKKTLRILRRIFPFRSCKRIPKKPCLWYQLERCPAPCLLKKKGLDEKSKEYKELKVLSQKNIKNLKSVLQGNSKKVIKNLEREMKKLSQKEEFERAALLRDKIFALKDILYNVKILEERETQEINWEEIQKKLRKILGIKRKIERIEGYDISDIQGKMAVASLVTFLKGKPEKNLYRRFKIKAEGKPNDFLMIQEALFRRMHHPEWEFPDLILIDGGKGQLNAALKGISLSRIKKSFFVVALAKGKNKLFLENKKNPLFLKDLPEEVSNLLLRARDEAHRFAISYHRNLRKKKLLEG